MAHPPAEIDVDLPLVRRLLEAECPFLAGERLSLCDEGWDNVIVRVGRDHAVRLPRRAAAVSFLQNEQRWLPVLAERLPLTVPEPVHVGAPGPIFPWPWSVVKWIDGQTAEGHSFSVEDAELLAATLRALHEPAPDEAPVNPFRGLPLATRIPALEERLERHAQSREFDVVRLRAMWQEAIASPPTQERRWIHGDLHPRNLVFRDGSLHGLIDWGDLNGGDVATDVACAWTLIDNAAVRRRFLGAYGAPKDVILRARGWAIHLGLALYDSGEPRHTPLGLATLERVIADSRDDVI